MTVSGFLVLRWVSLLVDVSVKSVLLLAGTGALLLLLRRASAAARHLVWLLTFGSLLCLPFLSAALPGWHVRAWPHLLSPGAGLPAWAATDGGREIAKERKRESPAFRSDHPLTRVPERTETRSARRRIGETERSGAVGSDSVNPRLSPWTPCLRVLRVTSNAGSRVFALSRFRVLKQSVADWSGRPGGAPPAWPATLCLMWLAGVGAVLAQVGTGIAQVRRMGRRCPRVTEGPLVVLLRALNREVGHQRPVILRMADRDQPSVVPMTWGWTRPVVLLPADAARWPEGRLRSVLLHELAHVRRGDWPAQLLTYATCALYWFHPLIWLAARQMRLESERACDDRVLAAGVHAPEYASHLLEIVRSLRGPRRPLRAALTAAPQSPIERRLRSILEERRSRRAAPRWAVPLALAIAAGTVIPLAGVRPLDEGAAGSGRQIAAVVRGQRRPGRTTPSAGSVVAILETTGHSTALAGVTIRRWAESPRPAGQRQMPREAPRRLPARSVIPGPRLPSRIGIRLLAELPPAAPVLPVPAPAPQPAPRPAGAPMPAPQPAPQPAPRLAAAPEEGLTGAIPADYVRDDSDEGDRTLSAAAAAFVDEHADAGAGDPPVADSASVTLAAAVNPEESEAVPASPDPEPDTAVLPAAGQDADVLPAPAKETKPADDSCLRWAAQGEAAGQAAVQRRFIVQPVLVWDPDAGEWVRLLLVWDRTPNGDPENEDRDVAPEPALTQPQPDPEVDLTEPAVIAQELPRWEQLFDRWEKAFAQRRRQHVCPPGSAL